MHLHNLKITIIVIVIIIASFYVPQGRAYT